LLAADRLSDATLISVLAYAGLRPGEALALRWEHITRRAIGVEAAVAHGALKCPKTGERRSVRLLAPLAADLAELREASPPADDSSFVFPGADEGPLTDDQWRNWRRRIFAPAAKSIGLDSARPYDLRHSFVSLLIHEGRSIVEVARQAGHSPTTCLTTYAHVFDQTEELERIPADEQIQRARTQKKHEYKDAPASAWPPRRAIPDLTLVPTDHRPHRGSHDVRGATRQEAPDEAIETAGAVHG
jgi:integrase